VPRTVAIKAIKKDALYFGLPDDLNIKEANKLVSFPDRNKLMKSFHEKNELFEVQKRNESAAWWACKKFLKETTSGTAGVGQTFQVKMKPILIY
jgi:hypothetical protein